MDYVLFFIGFIILIRGAEWLVDGASVLARRLGVSSLVIGLTVVAFGTSLPELVVNLFANTGEGSSDIAIGNILGSNIANILLVLGVAAIIHPLTVTRTTVYREILFNLMASVMLGVLVADAIFNDANIFNGLDRIDGIVLMSYFIIFLYYNFGRKHRAKEIEEATKEKTDHVETSVPTIFLRIAGGVIGLALGGRWIVSGAVAFADAFGVGQELIGLTIVAIGTSLPELATSVIAAMRKNVDIAVGNAVGSNLFNLFWVFGLSALIQPLHFSTEVLSDVAMVIIVSALLFGSMAVGKYKHQISKVEGWIFLSIYIVYIFFITIRG